MFFQSWWRIVQIDTRHLRRKRLRRRRRRRGGGGGEGEGGNQNLTKRGCIVDICPRVCTNQDQTQKPFFAPRRQGQGSHSFVHRIVWLCPRGTTPQGSKPIWKSLHPTNGIALGRRRYHRSGPDPFGIPRRIAVGGHQENAQGGPPGGFLRKGRHLDRHRPGRNRYRTRLVRLQRFLRLLPEVPGGIPDIPGAAGGDRRGGPRIRQPADHDLPNREPSGTPPIGGGRGMGCPAPAVPFAGQRWRQDPLLRVGRNRPPGRFQTDPPENLPGGRG
mmetsp:Transcript_13710/g.31995  ORF Transcript_13710/g.31995 Transcript_13710/m.31995 type:complete len:273 (-) Transcript_13710:265-1083(-)